ncbi:metal ABC transporter permease [Acidocella facilis]|uniref:metal ABC transporter permease n=1 Tax=Acidocella facilis TaxID=525 RepID=UPI001F2E667C|nr:metal ABC transporter permease [Acidocella facilis]
MSWLAEIWLATSLVALAAGAAGYFVVVRRAGFAAHSLPMAAFPGAAAASLFGVPLWLGLGGFALGGAGLLALMQRRARRDSATALLLSGLLALGALFLSLSGHYAGSVYGLLFGQVFALGPADLPVLGAIGLCVPLALWGAMRPLSLSALSPELTRVQGGNPALLEFLFLALLALAAGFAVPVTGALLVFSLMLGPGAAASRLCARPGGAFALSMALALGLSSVSLALAYVSDWPMGFFTGVGAALVYLAARAVRA